MKGNNKRMEALIKNIEGLTKRYKELDIEASLDWKKFNYYAIVHHSTSIEGSSLTEEETDLFLEENITAKGKPLDHHLMQRDHLDALLHVVKSSDEKFSFTIDYLKNVSSMVMKNTGKKYNTALGSFDSSKGDIRIVNVRAGKSSFPNFKKVPDLLELYCDNLNKKIKNINNSVDAILTSFDAHYNLVSIHPFADGDGRVSRLMMNHVQNKFNIPLSIVFKEDKAEYYKALVNTRENEDISIFRKFMLGQHIKHLEQEINKVISINKKVDKIINHNVKDEVKKIINKENKENKKKSKGFGMGMML